MAEKIIDVISYEGDNETLIYKYPQIDFNLGSQLVVHESQEAVFFRDGKALESFFAGRHTLETQNIAHLKELVNDLADGKGVFHSDVYFINLTTELGVKWGTDSKIRMFDPISGLHLELGACGTFNIKVDDGRKLLLKVVGTTSGFKKEQVFDNNVSAGGLFKGMIVSKVKSSLAKAIRENDINILEVDEHLDELSEIIRTQLNVIFEDYGMTVPEFFITTIVTPDNDPNFVRLREQHAARYLKVQEQRIRKAEAEAKQEVVFVEAETEARAAVIRAEGAAAVTIATGRAEAEVMRAKGYTYQDETARIVGKAAAENESSGNGASIVSDIVKTGVGLGVGVQVAKTVAGTVSNIIVAPDGSWECPECKHAGNKGKFCENCGYSAKTTWDCPNCGQSGLSGNFCSNCGHKKGE